MYISLKSIPLKACAAVLIAAQLAVSAGCSKAVIASDAEKDPAGASSQISSCPSYPPGPVPSSGPVSIASAAAATASSHSTSSKARSASKAASSSKASSKAKVTKPQAIKRGASQTQVQAQKAAQYTPLVFSEVRGVWVVTAWNNDFPQTSGAQKQKAEIDKILQNVKKQGLNTVFFQVRPMSDAFYASSIYPWSKYLTGTQGKNPGYDPLGYLVTEAHKMNIAVHAWINPFRVCSVSDFTNCSKNSPAVMHKDWTVRYTDSSVHKDYIWFNPGLPQARELAINGIIEIVRKYNVDGIHLDDYFYPYSCAYYENTEKYAGEKFNDSAAYKKYGGGMGIDDWRRNNIDEFISRAYAAVKSVNKKTLFGVSPFGIWATKAVMPTGAATTGSSSYMSTYADSKLWVEKHWVDYICPQLYWGFDTRYAVMADWWSSLCSSCGVDMYVGLDASIALGGQGKWTNSAGINEVQYARAKPSYKGSVFYSYSQLSAIEPLLTSLYK